MPETGNTPQYRYTSEVAELLCTTRKNIIIILFRSVGLQKPKKSPTGDYLWTQDDIDRFIAYRNRRKKA